MVVFSSLGIPPNATASAAFTIAQNKARLGAHVQLWHDPILGWRGIYGMEIPDDEPYQQMVTVKCACGRTVATPVRTMQALIATLTGETTNEAVNRPGRT